MVVAKASDIVDSDVLESDSAGVGVGGLSLLSLSLLAQHDAGNADQGYDGGDGELSADVSRLHLALWGLDQLGWGGAFGFVLHHVVAVVRVGVVVGIWIVLRSLLR